MKKKTLLVMALAVVHLQAEVPVDIAVLIGYNKFNDSEFLKKSSNFYGVRMGIYPTKRYGIQVGYEKADGVNCQGLNFKRTYVNTLLFLTPSSDFNPYGIATLGYESSNIHRFKPSQLFVGAGVGVKANVTPDVNTFIETRMLKKLKSNDTDMITTLGVGYQLR